MMSVEHAKAVFERIKMKSGECGKFSLPWTSIPHIELHFLKKEVDGRRGTLKAVSCSQIRTGKDDSKKSALLIARVKNLKTRYTSRRMREFDFDGMSERLISPTVITVGCFDGVHIGHACLFREVFRIEKETGLQSTVASFRNPPFKGEPLMTYGERRESFIKAGFQNLIALDFSASFGRMGAEEFLARLFEVFAVRAIVEGEDFRCGRDAEWGRSEIQAWCAARGVKSLFLPPVCSEGERVSSSLIRRLIKMGKTKEAKRLLL